jgi:hypothetical protein
LRNARCFCSEQPLVLHNVSEQSSRHLLALKTDVNNKIRKYHEEIRQNVIIHLVNETYHEEAECEPSFQIQHGHCYPFGVTQMEV